MSLGTRAPAPAMSAQRENILRCRFSFVFDRARWWSGAGEGARAPSNSRPYKIEPLPGHACACNAA